MTETGHSTREIRFIPDRLNEEPVIFIGCTDSELKLLAGVAFGLWLPLSLVVAALLGKAILGVAAGAVLAFASIWVVGRRLRVIKRGRPKGFHVMTIQAWLQDHGLKPRTFIRENRVWDIHRNPRAKP